MIKTIWDRLFIIQLKYDFRYGDYLQMGIVGEKDAVNQAFCLAK